MSIFEVIVCLASHARPLRGVKHLLMVTAMLAFLPSLFGQQFVDESAALEIAHPINSNFNGSGLSTFDFNLDGYDDISCTTSSGEMILYKNGPNGFSQLNLNLISAGDVKQLLWVDYDNDGDSDVLITSENGPVVLYQNDGALNFDDVTADANLPTEEGLYTGASFADYDLDGDVDLYLCKYSVNSPEQEYLENRNLLFRNDANGTFTDVTDSSQVAMPPAPSFQSVWIDYNNDLWPDLFVINDKLPGNYFFVNNQDGTFTEWAAESGLSLPGNDIMSNTAGDFDRDGDLDVFMTNHGDSLLGGSTLLCVNQGFEEFEELSDELNANIYDFAWGGVWIDAENSGYDDIIFVTPGPTPIYYLKNISGELFEDQTDELLHFENKVAYSPATGDFNNDGFSDVAIQCGDGQSPYVMMNQGAFNRHLKITLEGTISNKNAIGSWVSVFVGGEEFKKYTMCGENYLGQNSQHLVFGLGESVLVDSVHVQYPSGHLDYYYNIPANSHLYSLEGESFSVSIDSPQGTAFCSGDSLLLQVNGTYNICEWSDGSVGSLKWVTTGGMYAASVENASGIAASDSIEITEIPIPELSFSTTNPLCANGSDGSIEVSDINGTPADSIVWNNGQQGSDLKNLSTGQYICTYFAVNGCNAVGVIHLIEPPILELYSSTFPENGYDNDGEISLYIFGGVPPYTVLMDGIEVGQAINNLAAGDYYFQISDSHACTIDTILTVQNTLNKAHVEEHSPKVFPIPSSSVFHISALKNIASISVTNKLGQKVLQQSSTESQVQLTGLSPGKYLLEINFSDGSRSVVSIIKN